MGNGAVRYSTAAGGRTDLLALQEEFKQKVNIPMEVKVAHYTPSSFPLIPLINRSTSQVLKESWQRIVQNTLSENGNITSGITIFYNEFYERLGILDTSGRFEAVLTRNVDGISKLEAKGAILIRIVKYIMSIEEDSRDTQYSLYVLGKSHSHKGIRPWQYSIFVQTLLLTISSRLGTGATSDVMEAWVNMFAFVMKSMLPPAIEHQVIETEINVNTSSDFADEDVKQELVAAEDTVSMRRQFRTWGGTTTGQTGSPVTSRRSSAAPSPLYN